MDNCFTDRRDRSRQTTEKAVLYKLPAGPVTECTFARRHTVLPSYLDMLTVSRLFRLARGVYRCVFVELWNCENMNILTDNYKLFILN